MTIVLGIDPGMERLGWGIVESVQASADPTDMSALACPQLGVIEFYDDPLLKWNDNLDAGVYNITESFPRIIQFYHPTEIAAELVPAGKLGSRSDTVRAAITVCKVIAYQFGLPWTDYGANTIKKGIAGDGNATKAQVRNAVFALFPEWKERNQQVKADQKRGGAYRPQGIPTDAFDGVAIAVNHLRQGTK